MSTFEIACEHCRSRYVLPAELRDRLRGQLTTCVVCMREWTPVPADPRAWTSGIAAPAPALHPFLQSNPYAAAPAAPAADVGLHTQALRVAAAGGGHPNLRVVASGPGLELDAVFELGGLGFLIGGHGTHLELPHAHTLPDRAIRIRATTDGRGGFEFEGLDGYLIPIGPVRVAAGRIEGSSRLDLLIDPYRITLEPSAQKGGPIRDLDDRPAPAAAPPPSAPAPAPAAAAPPAPVAPSGGDMSQTVRGLAAFGFDSRRFSNPLEDLDVGLIGMDPPVQGETFWFRKSPTLIGRAAGDIVIPDTRVSGKHAQIDVLGADQYALKDLASTNGTTVNERPASITRLKDGDVVAFGGVRLQFVARAKKKKA